MPGVFPLKSRVNLYHPLSYIIDGLIETIYKRSSHIRILFKKCLKLGFLKFVVTIAFKLLITVYLTSIFIEVD